MPLWTLFTLIQPLLWLLIFTQLFKNFVQSPPPGGGSYIDFFVPGVLIMTALFGSSWSGVSLLLLKAWRDGSPDPVEIFRRINTVPWNRCRF